MTATLMMAPSQSRILIAEPYGLRYHLILQNLSPIVHGDTVVGLNTSTNKTLFLRRPLADQTDATRTDPPRYPTLSENAFRAVAVRRPLADHLIETLDLAGGALPAGVQAALSPATDLLYAQEGQLSQATLNLLYSGGAIAAGKIAPTSRDSLGRLVRSRYPSIDLLGGSVDRFMLPAGRLKVNIFPITQEYLGTLQHFSYLQPASQFLGQDLLEEARRLRIRNCLYEETRTRGTGAESSGNQMLYSYEALASGVKFVVRFTLDQQTSPVTVAALAKAIEKWDRYFGGSSRQGRGLMQILCTDLPDSEPYLAHLARNKDQMRAGLLDGTFGTSLELCAR